MGDSLFFLLYAQHWHVQTGESLQCATMAVAACFMEVATNNRNLAWAGYPSLLGYYKEFLLFSSCSFYCVITFVCNGFNQIYILL